MELWHPQYKLLWLLKLWEVYLGVNYTKNASMQHTGTCTWSSLHEITSTYIPCGYMSMTEIACEVKRWGELWVTELLGRKKKTWANLHSSLVDMLIWCSLSNQSLCKNVLCKALFFKKLWCCFFLPQLMMKDTVITRPSHVCGMREFPQSVTSSSFYI